MGDHPNDDELWARTQQGDTAAYGTIYDRHVTTIYRFAYRLTGNTHDAEDLTSKTFMTLWDRRHNITTQNHSLRPALHGITNNHARNRWRKTINTRRSHERLARQQPASVDNTSDLAHQLDADAELQRVLEQTAALPRKERETLELLVLGELTYAEIAEALNIPIGTVRSRIAKARSRLKPRTPNAPKT